MTTEFDITVHVASRADIHEIKHALAHLLTKQDAIMTKVADFASKQGSFNETIATAVTGLQGDIAALNAQIAALQGTTGAITPEDQALLDDLELKGAEIAQKVSDLDALTPADVA